MRWTTREVSYLEAHAEDGAAAIAAALGRTEQSVRQQAKRYGLSLRLAYRCPRCGRRVHSPLSESTGWCASCTRSDGRDRVAEHRREIEAEAAREEEERRRRQRDYARRSRAKKRRNQ